MENLEKATSATFVGKDYICCKVEVKDGGNYEGIPSLELRLVDFYGNILRTGYLHMFRNSWFQVSDDNQGHGDFGHGELHKFKELTSSYDYADAACYWLTDESVVAIVKWIRGSQNFLGNILVSPISTFNGYEKREENTYLNFIMGTYEYLTGKHFKTNQLIWGAE